MNSSYIQFANGITGRGFSPRVISKAFDALVDPVDYSVSDRKSLMHHLLKLSQKTAVE